jgi:hypothetical protein
MGTTKTSMSSNNVDKEPPPTLTKRDHRSNKA